MIKKNLDYINSNAKNTLLNINTVKNTIKNTEILINLSKAVIEIDKIPVLEDITNKIKSEVAVVESLPIVAKTKKASGRAEILSLMIKVEQGKAKEKDYVNLAQKLSKEFGIKSLEKPLNIAKNLLDLKNNLNNFENSDSASLKIASILLALGNVASISPIPMAQTLAPILQSVGETITTYKPIQNLIDEEIEISFASTMKNIEEGRLPFFPQFVSDFAVDAFIYNDSDIESKHSLKDVFKEVRDST